MGAPMMSPLDRLREAPEEINPALLMAWRVKSLELGGKLDMAALISMAGEMDEARVAGGELVAETDRAFAHLTSATPQASTEVPTGF